MHNDKQLLKTIKHLILKNEMRSQFELAVELNERGYKDISQSKVSRMLTKLGAVRMRNHANQLTYRLPTDVGLPGLTQSLDSVVLACEHNETVVIVKTQAGGAKIVARVLDQLHGELGISGTVASDDTLFVMPHCKVDTTTLYKHICEILDFYHAA